MVWKLPNFCSCVSETCEPKCIDIDLRFVNWQFRVSLSKLIQLSCLSGCGNSLLGEELYADGYHDIHNIDISPSVIQLMENHCDKCSKMKWSVMDCRQLRFANQSFDVVIEKATIEVFLVAEKSPWSISKSALQTLKMIGDEIGRVLKQSAGQFFSISFSAPHFRQPLYQRIFQGEDHSNTMVVANIHRLGEHFHYFLYHLVNDLSVQSMSLFTYEPPKQTKLHDHITNDDCNLFLYDISI